MVGLRNSDSDKVGGRGNCFVCSCINFEFLATTTDVKVDRKLLVIIVATAGIVVDCTRMDFTNPLDMTYSKIVVTAPARLFCISLKLITNFTKYWAQCPLRYQE